MNSMAQQAVPNGIGQMEDLRPHLTTASTVVVMMSPPPWTEGYRVGSSILPRKMSSRPIAGPIILGGRRGGQGERGLGRRHCRYESVVVCLRIRPPFLRVAGHDHSRARTKLSPLGRCEPSRDKDMALR